MKSGRKGDVSRERDPFNEHVVFVERRDLGKLWGCFREAQEQGMEEVADGILDVISREYVRLDPNNSNSIDHEEVWRAIDLYTSGRCVE